ncbi:hypothetical protein [Pedobacter aquatilis]|nr:hypothetical protein [Pedobacter aquatilis]
MIELHRQRYEWTHDEALIRRNFTDFAIAEADNQFKLKYLILGILVF